jgi:hypothetical protein
VNSQNYSNGWQQNAIVPDFSAQSNGSFDNSINENDPQTFQFKTKSLPPLEGMYPSSITNDCNKNKPTTKNKYKKKNKKYTTAYGLFFREYHSKILETCPSLDFGTVSKNVAIRWRGMNKLERRPYKNLVQKKSYSTNYGRFFRHHYGQIKASNPKASFGAISSTISQMWDCLTISQKRSYENPEKALNPNIYTEDEVPKETEKIKPTKCSKNSFVNIVDINFLKNLNFDDHDNNNNCFSNDQVEANTEFVLDMKRVPCFTEVNRSQQNY